MDKVPLGVGVVVGGLAVILLLSKSVDLEWGGSIRTELDLRAIFFVATGKVDKELGVRVADDAVEVGANEVGHVGGLGFVG